MRRHDSVNNQSRRSSNWLTTANGSPLLGSVECTTTSNRLLYRLNGSSPTNRLCTTLFTPTSEDLLWPTLDFGCDWIVRVTLLCVPLFINLVSAAYSGLSILSGPELVTFELNWSCSLLLFNSVLWLMLLISTDIRSCSLPAWLLRQCLFLSWD